MLPSTADDCLGDSPESTCERAAATVAELLQTAFSAHQAGRVDEALAGYQAVLAEDQFHVDALHLLGILHQQTGNPVDAERLIRSALSLHEDALIYTNLGLLLQGCRRLDEAEEAYRCAIDLAPDLAEAHNHLGNVLYETGRLPEAEGAYRQAIETRPEFADAHNNLGNVLKAMHRMSDAESSYRQAITLDAGFVLAHFNLGGFLHAMSRLQEAEAAYHQVLELSPDFIAAHNNLGLVIKDAGRTAEAELVYRRALALMPSFYEAHYNLANLLSEAERFPEAEASYLRALELNPCHTNACCNLGNLFKTTGRLLEAEESYLRVLELRPDDAPGYFNLANLYQQMCCWPAALEAYKRAVALEPDYAEAHYNLGKLLSEMGRLPEADAAYRRALKVQPDFASARWNLALLLLSAGCYAEAWQCYESRYAEGISEKNTDVPNLPFPQWTGEPLEGKSLVIWPEQGFGDYIQFVRYAPLLKARGVTRLTLMCRPPLEALLRSVEGVDEVLTEPAKLGRHDYWCFALSLPLRFDTTVGSIPAQLPYLYAQPARIDTWRSRLPAEGFKVGLVWKGNAAHLNDTNRSLDGLDTLSPLWSVPGVTFISLQTGPSGDEAKQLPASQPILHLSDEMGDFADTAAIVAQLDLVICVDTATAHLAGAMGIPCWVLLPAKGTDWRWFRERTDSPWYPRVVRLFRQVNAGEWTATVREVAAALHMHLSSVTRPVVSRPPTHVFFVHSPITYSMALATIAHLQIEKPILIGVAP